MTTPPDKLDLRTCPLPALCEWVAVNIMVWRRKGVWMIPQITEIGKLAWSLDAVAAVECKARDGRLKGWLFRNGTDGVIRWAYWGENAGGTISANCDDAPTESEARLRAVALAFEAAGKEGR